MKKLLAIIAIISAIIIFGVFLPFKEYAGKLPQGPENSPVDRINLPIITPEVESSMPVQEITPSRPEKQQVDPIVPQPTTIQLPVYTPQPKINEICESIGLYLYDGACHTQQKEESQQIIINIEEQTMPINKISSEKIVEPIPTESAIIEIIDAIPGKGLGRKYIAYDWDKFNSENIPDSERPVNFVFPDESNSIDLGIIIRDSKRQSVKDATLTIEATDNTQNKELVGTGITKKMRNEDGEVSEIASYYPYHYDFKTVGKHTLIFSSGGIEVSVDLDVSAE